MKHKIKIKGLTAYCSNPCCQVSVWGGLVEGGIQSVRSFFTSECPYISANGGLNGKSAIKHILKYGKKEIKTWEKAIKFWDKQL